MLRKKVKLGKRSRVQLLTELQNEGGKCGGKPCIRGMRREKNVRIIATHRDPKDLFHEYPFLKKKMFSRHYNSLAASVDNEVLEVKPGCMNRVRLDQGWRLSFDLINANSFRLSDGFVLPKDLGRLRPVEACG